MRQFVFRGTTRQLHFSFELNDQGGRVNGKALTPEQATKYRQLMNLPTTKIKGSKTNFGITVDEN